MNTCDQAGLEQERGEALVDRDRECAHVPDLPPAERSDGAYLVFLAALVLISGMAAFVGIAPIRLFGHDIFFFLDNTYRVLQGQVPHRDFSSAWGPLTYLIEAAGLLLSGMRPAGIGYANALFAPLIGIWTWRMGRNRLPSPIRCALAIYTMLLIAGPFSLGWGVFNFSHAMTYNRYGYALVGIILLECCAPFLGVKVSGRQSAFGAASTGAAWALLTFVKVSYGIVAFPFIVLSFVSGVARRERLVALCAAFGIVAAIVLAYLRFDLADLLNDLRFAASGKSQVWNPADVLKFGFGHFGESLPLAFLALAVSSSRKAGATGWGWRFRVCLLAGIVLAVGGFVVSMNHQPSTLPLNGFAAVLVASTVFPRRKGGWASLGRLDPLRSIVIFLVAVCLLPLSLANAGSLIAAATQRRQLAADAGVSLAVPRGADLIFAPVPTLVTTETGGPGYVIALNDGLDLLRRHTGPRDGVLALDMFNPFNYLLGRPSPRGGLAAAAFNLVASDRAHPSPEQFFGDTKFVMERKYSRSVEDYDIEVLHIERFKRLYEGLLQERFSLIAESEHWLLYGPKKTAEAAGRSLK
jgi:hypothetical protein